MFCRRKPHDGFGTLLWTRRDYCGTEDLKTILWGEYGDNLIEVNGFPKMNKAKWGDESYLDDLFSRMQAKICKE